MTIKPMVLGVTGGIGSGKSIVCQFFRVLGIPVYAADERAKWLIHHSFKIQKQIIDTFGSQAFINGIYNNQYIAQKVFQSDEELQKLNAIIHPAVVEDYSNWVNEYSNKAPFLVKEAAIMLELPKDNRPDKIMVVHAPEEIRVNRVKKRDPQRSDQEIRNIISKQMPQQQMIEQADFLIDNSGNVLVIPQVLKIFSTLRGNIVKS